MNYILDINLYNKNGDLFDISNISSIKFILGDIVKTYPQEVKFNNNLFVIPLSESEKQYLDSDISRHYEITYINGTSKTTDIIQGSVTKYIHEDTRYDDLVNSKIRTRYSESREFAILRQQERKTAEFKEYDDYCEQCKLDAKKELGL